MKNTEFYTLILILLTVVIIISGSVGYNTGYENGKYDGHREMFIAVIDTMNTILKNQIESDSTVTEMTIVNLDTNTHF